MVRHISAKSPAPGPESGGHCDPRGGREEQGPRRFPTVRTSRVERFNAAKERDHDLLRGVRRHARAAFIPGSRSTPQASSSGSTRASSRASGLTRYEPMAARAFPPAVVQGITDGRPRHPARRRSSGSPPGTPGRRYEAFGRVDRGRAAEVATGPTPAATRLSVSIPLNQVPRAARDASTTRPPHEKRLVGFRPTEARLLTSSHRTGSVPVLRRQRRWRAAPRLGRRGRQGVHHARHRGADARGGRVRHCQNPASGRRRRQRLLCPGRTVTASTITGSTSPGPANRPPQRGSRSSSPTACPIPPSDGTRRS